MYWSKDVKNLLFDFRSDINYVIWVILSILKVFNCNNKKNSFKDYQKISFVIQLMHDSENMDSFIRLINGQQLNVYEAHKLSSCYFSSKIEERTINSALIILDKKKIINFHPTKERVNVYCDRIQDYNIMNGYKDVLEVLLSSKRELYYIKYNEILKKINNFKVEDINA
ncbi:hypothetical protein [Clostridium sp. YIM B02506]|uniref:hypothetical protein n=1 Tax=Clostridium sp. YIM B02506 TaxID=2910680 RepID=UPI001EEEC216|nr:hypothetical protein [Clostridium sp. YIM B02506]